jgi:hypothetical protein
MTLVQVAASIGTPQKKQHIMISYNRSCEDGCRKIRNKLRVDKYYFRSKYNLDFIGIKI